MTTQHLRHRRALSMTRRDGSQITYQAAMGRTARHSQSWGDLQPRRRGNAFTAALRWAPIALAMWLAAFWMLLRVADLLAA